MEAWANSWYVRDYDLITAPTDNFLVALVLQPARCQEEFESLVVGDLQFLATPCSQVESQYRMDLDANVDCIVGVLDGAQGGDLRSIAQNLDLRTGNFHVEQSSSSTMTLVLDDGSSLTAIFMVSACFNQTHAIESS